MREKKAKEYILLHVLFLIYSFGGVFSKRAGQCEFLSKGFLLNYAAVILILFIYAVFWRMILKKLPLTAAYAGKAVTVIWGIILGSVMFGEKITVLSIAGAVLIIAGICLFVSTEEEESE